MSAATPEKTQYLVLERENSHPEQPELQRWHEVAVVPAHSADHAIRQSGKHGLLVAVPARSWKPRKVTTEQKTVTKVEAVGA